MKEVKTDGVVSGFEMYQHVDGGKLVGKSGAKDGKPAPPATWFKE